MRAVLRRIRIRKKDSAYVYCILESHEGLCGYSTLGGAREVAYCDLELQIPPDLEAETDRVIEDIRRDLGGELVRLDP